MNILIIPDKFKGSLTAAEVIEAIKEGLHRINPAITTHSILASDGGDGFLEVIRKYLNPLELVCETVDPLGRTIHASYLFDEEQKTAYVELAKASGLELLSKTERRVVETSTFGTGLQLKHAIENGAERIYVGLGGSATNDAGTGIAAALGGVFYTATEQLNIPEGKDLEAITNLDCSALENYKEVPFFAVNDVENPLFGKNGAAFTYGKQKGATAGELQQLDAGLRNISDMVQKKLHKDVAMFPGSGAAGGAAYGLKAFLHADFIGGTEFVLGLTDFFDIISSKKIDVIITGEGKIDQQTQNGKLIKGISTLAARHAIPVVAICGALDLDASGIKMLGLTAALEIKDNTQPDAYSFEHAAALIKDKIGDLIDKFIV